MDKIILNVFSNGDVQRNEYKPKFARVRHFSQSPVYGYLNYMAGRLGNFKDGANDPSVFKYPYQNESFLYLDRDRENWWFERLAESADGSGMSRDEILTAWRNLVNPKKAFTNNRDLSVWGYILNSGKALRLEPIIATGTTIKLIGEKYKKSDGNYWQDFEVIDMLKDDYKSMTIKTHWWLIPPATSSLSIGTSGRVERINPFPKMRGDRMTPYFLHAKGTTRASIRADWLEYIYYDIEKPAYPYLPFRTTADTDRFDLRNI